MSIKTLFIDRVHRIPRLWSNAELGKVAHLFEGDIVNVSAWQDSDKNGKTYKSYFTKANSYSITNWKADARGFQGEEGELFLDLEQELSSELIERFDLVFNHTTLEHIYDVKTAFANLCRMSRDAVVIVVPFLQQYHGAYGDYWRFTPLLIKKMFEDCGFHLAYISFNNQSKASVYIFAVAVRDKEKWQSVFDFTFELEDKTVNRKEPFIGAMALPNIGYRLLAAVGAFIKKLSGKSGQ